jgi:O-antigen/teichoic acid export membrane protein
LGASQLSLLRADSIVTHNLIVTAGSVLAGVLGFAFQSIISHRLDPADYGGVFAVVTLITVIGLPGSALTLLMAREASRDRASGHHAASTALLREGNRILLLFGCGLTIVAVVASPLLVSFLHVPIDFLLAAALGMPFTFALPLLFGELQGEQHFAAFAGITAGQSGVKLVAALGIGYLLGPVGVVVGISLAGAVTYVVVHGILRRRLALQARWPWQRPALAYLAIIVPSTLALAILLSADVLLVKHFFPARMAGEYGAVAGLGRAIFWGAVGVAAVLFPKIVFRESQGRTTLSLLLASLCLVAAGGGFALLVLGLGSKPLLAAFAGQLYVSGSEYLPWYAFGMTLMGAAAVLIATHQSRGKRTFLSVLVPIAAAEPVLIILRHGSVMEVIWILDACMAALVIGLLSLYVADERRIALPDYNATKTALTPSVAEGMS